MNSNLHLIVTLTLSLKSLLEVPACTLKPKICLNEMCCVPNCTYTVKVVSILIRCYFQMDIFDASERYREEKRQLIILAGKDYGSGSSRDWAAKGPWMLVIFFFLFFFSCGLCSNTFFVFVTQLEGKKSYDLSWLYFYFFLNHIIFCWLEGDCRPSVEVMVERDEKWRGLNPVVVSYCWVLCDLSMCRAAA